MNARASIVAGANGIELRSEAPLALRTTPDGVFMVGSAAGPIGGDQLALIVLAREDARLRVRSAAAQIALPGHGTSRFVVRARVASGATLHWHPEPTIAADGCRHEIDVFLVCDLGARVVWSETVVLGRDGERGGKVTTRMRVDVGGRPVLRQTLTLGEGTGSDGPAIVGDAKAVRSQFVLGYEVRPGADGGRAVMALAGGGTLISEVASPHAKDWWRWGGVEPPVPKRRSGTSPSAARL